MSESGNRRKARFPIRQTLFLDLFLDRKARPIFIYVTFFIIVCAALFHWLEGWSWLDSVYFVVITFTTIGYGDFVPTMPIAKVITILVSLNGVAILLMLFDEIRRVRSWQKIEVPTEDQSVKES